jgi:hypothetical protein
MPDRPAIRPIVYEQTNRAVRALPPMLRTRRLHTRGADGIDTGDGWLYGSRAWYTQRSPRIPAVKPRQRNRHRLGHRAFTSLVQTPGGSNRAGVTFAGFPADIGLESPVRTDASTTALTFSGDTGRGGT